jgi:hypothetical protein
MRGDGPGCSFESRTRSRSPISARMAALWSELRLRAFCMKSTSRVAVRPDANTREPGIRSGRKYKSELKKGEARSGPTSAAVARPLASPLPDRFSADRDGRIRSTGTSVVPRHREAALGSITPRNGGKLVVQPVPYDNVSVCPKTRQFQNRPITKIHGTTR